MLAQLFLSILLIKYQTCQQGSSLLKLNKEIKLKERKKNKHDPNDWALKGQPEERNIFLSSCTRQLVWLLHVCQVDTVDT